MKKWKDFESKKMKQNGRGDKLKKRKNILQTSRQIQKKKKEKNL